MKLSSPLFPFILLLLPHLAPAKTSADEWTRFRGPGGSGVGQATGLPISWTETDYAWKVKLPGVGHASPVLWGSRLFSTCADEADGAQYVLAHDAITGKEVWRKHLSSDKYPHHRFNSFASATPCVDADRLYVSWTTKESNDLLCFDHDGNLLWRRDFGKYETQHGNGFSPIVRGNLVVLTHDHYGKSSILAVDRKTGETRWRTGLTSSKPSSSTPCAYQPVGGPLQFITNSMAHGCYAVSADTGKILWQTGPDTLDLRSVSSPFLAGGHFFASCGSGGRGSRFAAVRPPVSSQASPTLSYHFKKQGIPYVVTPIAGAKEELIFLLADGGILSCHDLATGTLKWRERIGGNFFASPVRAGSVIYATDREGKVTAFSAEDKYRYLGTSQLGELTYNTPAIANQSLYFRTYSHLIRIPAKE